MSELSWIVGYPTHVWEVLGGMRNCTLLPQIGNLVQNCFTIYTCPSTFHRRGLWKISIWGPSLAFMKKLLKYPSIWLIVWQNRKFWVENISYSSLKSLSIVVSVMFDAEWIPGFFVCFFSSGTVSEVTNNCYNLYSLMKGFMNKIQSKRYCLKERWQETLY